MACMLEKNRNIVVLKFYKRGGVSAHTLRTRAFFMP